MTSSADQTVVTPRYVIQGRTVTLPALVRDAGSASAIFLVPAEIAQSFVGPAFEVVEMMPGQTQLILGFVDYRDNDLGDYNESMIVFMVRPRGAGPEADGTFIYKLPVNQSFTCEAGCKIWGFPKTVEQIDVDYTPGAVTGRLVMGGRHVFTLTIPRPTDGGSDQPAIEMTTYTYHNGPTAVRFTTGGSESLVNPGSEGVQLILGDHPIADDLRRFGLPAPAMLSAWTGHMRGDFGAPQRLDLVLE